MKTRYRIFTSQDSDSEYDNIIQEEEFEEEPEAYKERFRKGSELDGGDEPLERERVGGGPVPWDPAESFFALI
jgi:hypothetical protein